MSRYLLLGFEFDSGGGVHPLSPIVARITVGKEESVFWRSPALPALCVFVEVGP